MLELDTLWHGHMRDLNPAWPDSAGESSSEAPLLFVSAPQGGDFFPSGVQEGLVSQGGAGN